MINQYDKLSDDELIEELRKGTAEIIDFIMDKYKYMVRKKAKAMYLLGGENDDLIQEGMIGLFKAVQDYSIESGSSFYSFADLCVSRQMYSAIEASQRKKHIPLNSYVSIYTEEGNLEQIDSLQETHENHGNPEIMLLGKEYQEGFQIAIHKQMSDFEKDVLHLYLKGEDYKQIAKLLKKAPKAIDNALQRIRKKANKILEDNQ